MTRSPLIVCACCLCTTLIACSSKAGGDTSTDKSAQDDHHDEFPAGASDVAETYARIVSASYGDSLVMAQALDAAVVSFVGAPSADGLSAARTAWTASREPYLQTEVFRFYDGPIDNPDDGPEGAINAWPMDEHYIDGTVDDPTSGIINNTALAIDAESLLALNEQGGEKNIATGYHAIEFLLWGQDLSEAGPGDRPFTDFEADGTAPNGERRGEYLTTVSALLVTHLDGLNTTWAEGGSYRTEWDGLAPETAVERILTGMIILSGFETGGERLQAALDSGDQEDEHSCFSDNTHRDMVQDVVGVKNVWDGQYTSSTGETISGTGVHALIDELDPELAGRLDARIQSSVDLANALVPPFDQEIAPGNVEGNARVQALIDSLRDQEDLLFEVFTALGLSVTLPE